MAYGFNIGTLVKSIINRILEIELLESARVFLEARIYAGGLYEALKALHLPYLTSFFKFQLINTIGLPPDWLPFGNTCYILKLPFSVGIAI
jgi:hypothetical protein